jgi:hypothetical protein
LLLFFKEIQLNKLTNNNNEIKEEEKKKLIRLKNNKLLGPEIVFILHSISSNFKI